MNQLILFFKVVTLVFAALASILNPPANVPIFLASTAGSSTDVRKALSWRIAVNVFIILVVSMFVGSYILAFFGLSLPIVQVAGGLLIMSFGWTFLHQREEDATAPSAQSWRPEELATRAFYPLTLPLTVGPGSMSVAITLGANTSQAGLYEVVLLVAMVTGVALVVARFGALPAEQAKAAACAALGDGREIVIVCEARAWLFVAAAHRQR